MGTAKKNGNKNTCEDDENERLLEEEKISRMLLLLQCYLQVPVDRFLNCAKFDANFVSPLQKMTCEPLFNILFRAVAS